MYVFASLFGTVAIALVLLCCLILILRHRASLIFDKYPRKGLFYHFKYALALLVLKHLRHKFYPDRRNSEAVPNRQAYLEQLDRPQELSVHPKSYDVISFMAANSDGQKLMITLERRRRGVLKACLYLWLPGQGLYCTPNLPDMVNFTTDNGSEAKTSEFRGSGFHIYPEQCMHSWRIRYEGVLRQVKNADRTAALQPVSLDLQFSSTTSERHFNYNRDLSAAVIADSIAREPWNDAFYSMLKNVEQLLEQRVHYEQSGRFEGELRLGAASESARTLQLIGFRDHSFGTERCLSTINRYVYFALFLDDGTSLVVGNLSQPSFFLSSLKVGYRCTRAGVYEPITRCNFELYSYGEKGTPPLHQNFIVRTASAEYFVQIRVEDSAVRYVGGNWESKVFNQFVACTVNGIRGQGFAEYLYRHKSGRPEEVSRHDPEWYQRVRQFERSLSNGEFVDDSEEFFF